MLTKLLDIPKLIWLIMRDRITCWWISDVCGMPQVAAHYLGIIQKEIEERREKQ